MCDWSGKRLISSLRQDWQPMVNVIRCLLFHQQEQNLTVKQSIRCTIEELLVIWRMARIQTQRVDSGERKLSKLYDTYLLLRKNRTKACESYRMKEQLFQVIYLNDCHREWSQETADVPQNRKGNWRVAGCCMY